MTLDPDLSDTAQLLEPLLTATNHQFFRVIPEEAKAVDPQQRFLLEVSYEAFENAGIPMESLSKTRTAVYMGSFVKGWPSIF